MYCVRVVACVLHTTIRKLRETCPIRPAARERHAWHADSTQRAHHFSAVGSNVSAAICVHSLPACLCWLSRERAKIGRVRALRCIEHFSPAERADYCNQRKFVLFRFCTTSVVLVAIDREQFSASRRARAFESCDTTVVMLTALPHTCNLLAFSPVKSRTGVCYPPQLPYRLTTR